MTSTGIRTRSSQARALAKQSFDGIGEGGRQFVASFENGVTTLGEEGRVPSFHSRIRTCSRSRGESAVAAAACRAGLLLVEHLTGLRHDYCHWGGVAGTICLANQWSARNVLSLTGDRSGSLSESNVVLMALPGRRASFISTSSSATEAALARHRRLAVMAGGLARFFRDHGNAPGRSADTDRRDPGYFLRNASLTISLPGTVCRRPRRSGLGQRGHRVSSAERTVS